MKDTLTIVSTSDTADQIQAALTGAPAPAEPAAKAPEAPAPATPPATPETPTPAPAATEEPAQPTAGDETPPPANETPEQKAERESKRDRRIAKIQSQIDTMVRKREDENRAYELTKAQRETEEAKLAAARAELARLQNGGDPDASPAPPAAAPAKADTPRPTVEGKTFDQPMPKADDTDAAGNPVYPDYDDFIAAVALWSAEKARFEARAEYEAAERARIERESAIRDTQDAVATYNTKLDAFKQTVAHDFDAVADDAAHDVAEIRRELGVRSLDIIDRYTTHDADNGPALVYHLLQHPDEMRRIAQLPMSHQLIELGKLDVRVGTQTPRQDAASPSGPSSVVPPVTQVPEPIQPVGPGSTAPVPRNLDELPYQEYKRIRNQQERDAMQR